MKSTKWFGLALSLVFSGFAIFFIGASAKPKHLSNYTFVVLSDGRCDPKDAHKYASQTNVNEYLHILSDVDKLQPTPKFFIYVGDMVMGYTKDTLSLARQLQAWLDLYEKSPLPAKGIQLIPIMGNHESQDKAAGKKAFGAAERTWKRVMKKYINGNNGPMAGTDSLTTNQDSLTYSFNFNNDHFVVLNTDPVGQDWRVPVNWIAKDLSTYRSKFPKGHIFVFGHKPAYPAYNGTDGLCAFPARRDAFWKILETEKCEAYLAGHNHLWSYNQQNPMKTIQVVAGNAGTPVDKKWQNPYFGFSIVTVNEGKKIGIQSLGHQIPVPYDTVSSMYPTTPRMQLPLTWGTDLKKIGL